MVSYHQRATSSPFSRAVVNSMRKLYPEALADKSFDNTGLLLEAPAVPSQDQRNLALLTIDLTRAVCTEALSKRASVVVAYHPIIFRPLKSLTLADTQQESLLRLAAAGISVYSPHTAVDAAPGGLSDWLADIVTGTVKDSEVVAANTGSGGDVAALPKQAAPPQRPGAGQRTYSRPTYPTPSSSGPDANPTTPSTQHTRSTILPSPSPPPGTHESAGIGRYVTFTQPQPLPQLIERIARGVGTPAGFPVAIPQGASVDKLQIRTVAVCAGSGGSVLREGDGSKADLWLTGELSHHEALAVTERGGCVVTLSHSNTERGYLGGVMQGLLQKELEKQWDEGRNNWSEEFGEEWKAHMEDSSVYVDVSEHDRDPYGIVLLQGSEVEAPRSREDDDDWGEWTKIRGGWRVRMAPVDEINVGVTNGPDHMLVEDWEGTETIVDDWRGGWKIGPDDSDQDDIESDTPSSHHGSIDLADDSAIGSSSHDISLPPPIFSSTASDSYGDDNDFHSERTLESQLQQQPESNTTQSSLPTPPKSFWKPFGLGIFGAPTSQYSESDDLNRSRVSERSPTSVPDLSNEKSLLEELEDELDGFLCSPLERYASWHDTEGDNEANNAAEGGMGSEVETTGRLRKPQSSGLRSDVSATEMTSTDLDHTIDDDGRDATGQDRETAVQQRPGWWNDRGWLIALVLAAWLGGQFTLVDLLARRF